MMIPVIPSHPLYQGSSLSAKGQRMTPELRMERWENNRNSTGPLVYLMRASERLQERFLCRIIMQFRNFYVSSNRDCSEQNFPCFSSVFFLEVLSGKGNHLKKKKRNIYIPDWSNVAITLAGLLTKRHFARPNVYMYVNVIKWLVPSARSTCTCNIMVGSIGTTSLAQQTMHMPNVMPTFSVKQCIGPTLPTLTQPWFRVIAIFYNCWVNC